MILSLYKSLIRLYLENVVHFAVPFKVKVKVKFSKARSFPEQNRKDESNIRRDIDKIEKVHAGVTKIIIKDRNSGYREWFN